MLQQLTKEKLHALRLHGMIEAIERQEQDEAARGLNFLDMSLRRSRGRPAETATPSTTRGPLGCSAI
jgi:hypothetical protein